MTGVCNGSRREGLGGGGRRRRDGNEVEAREKETAREGRGD